MRHFKKTERMERGDKDTIEQWFSILVAHLQSSGEFLRIPYQFVGGI